MVSIYHDCKTFGRKLQGGQKLYTFIL